MSAFPEPDPPRAFSSFASLFTSFTSKPADDTWDDSALADDIATISYEQALRAHRRTTSPEYATKALPNEIDTTTPASEPAEKQRKNASITLRLTAAEQAQLHDRATAANLSVSAYIRSCIFEAESLRTQVKEALTQMRSSTVNAPGPDGNRTSPATHKGLRLFSRWSKRNLPDA